MRTPGSIRRTSHVYQATFAAFLAVHRHNMATENPIETVVLPAMGTGYGGVEFDEAARQMAVAYKHDLHPPGRPTWDSVIRREKAICYDAGEKAIDR
jgi:O-acetyl-ADP-ribose deacetylase (regulator of RNase III)